MRELDREILTLGLVVYIRDPVQDPIIFYQRDTKAHVFVEAFQTLEEILVIKILVYEILVLIFHERYLALLVLPYNRLRNIELVFYDLLRVELLLVDSVVLIFHEILHRDVKTDNLVDARISAILVD